MKILRRQIGARAERGLSAVSLAIILPIFFMLTMGAMELFLYFRAVSVVQRAAAEAGEVAVAARPGPTNKYTPNSFQAVTAVETATTKSGGDTEGDISASFDSHGELYVSKGSSLEGTRLPFELSRTNNAESRTATLSTWNPGVMYLPFVSAPACLEPYNESPHGPSTCGEFPDYPLGTNRYFRYLTYQLPGRIDFDGDGHEDIAFYYPNSEDDDWWVLPSSGGGTFRTALRIRNLEESSLVSGVHWLPCPADYDGDEATDFCTAAISSNTVHVNIRFSTQHFYAVHTYALNGVEAGGILPVSGRWTAPQLEPNTDDVNGDSFAVVLLDGADSARELATYIWPQFTKTGKTGPVTDMYALANTPTKFEGAQYKPSPGRAWRPAFGDHDGNGTLDIGWATWPGGYNATHIAGTDSPGITNATRRAATASLSPWALAVSGVGLYVVETANHRVSLITPGADGLVNGGSDENYVRVAGADLSTTADYTLPDIDPTAKGLFSPGTVPTSAAPNVDACKTCFPGGSFHSDASTKATESGLNHPRDVYASSDDAIYIADFGNFRVRKVEHGMTSVEGIVNGTPDEVMSTVVGGEALFSCLAMHGYGPLPGEAALPWADWLKAVATAQSDGIHPRCVAIRPLSVAIDDSANRRMLIGDEQGVVFIVDPGSDGEFNADAEERMRVLVGKHGVWSHEKPSGSFGLTSGVLALPVGLAFLGSNRDLGILLSSASLPAAKAGVSDGPALTGGLVTVQRGKDGVLGTADDTLPSDPVVGAWSTTGQRVAYSNPWGRAAELFNPTAIASYDGTYGGKYVEGGFITGWLAHSQDAIYENSVRHYYRRADDAVGFVEWLNNLHSHSWGRRPPTAPDARWSFADFTPSKAAPLATLPVQPGAGVALSPNQEYLYISQTGIGNIIAVRMDKDGDGKQDFPNATNVAAYDTDADGDGVSNASDSHPLQFQSSDGTDTVVRPLETFPDFVMSATGTLTKMRLSAKSVDRLEWMVDRFTKVDTVPQANSTLLPGDEEPIFMSLNDDTIVAPNKRAILHGEPVWMGGISRPDEATLTPVVLGSRSPNVYNLKSVSGYDQCTDFDLYESSATTTLLPTGEPQSHCGRDVNVPVYTGGITAALRRAHLAHWLNQWHAFADQVNTSSDLVFVDWDGDGSRDPAVFLTEAVGSDALPLMVYIGNFTADLAQGNPCPGEYAQADLKALSAALETVFASSGVAFDAAATPQVDCAQGKFFTWNDVPYAAVLADFRAEWKTTNSTETVNLAAVTGDRLSLGAEGDGDISSAIGPVAETAYQILERTLDVRRRENATDVNSAKVAITRSPESPSGETEVTVEVTYVMPVFKVLAPILGRKTIAIKGYTTRRAYNFGRNL